MSWISPSLPRWYLSLHFKCNGLPGQSLNENLHVLVSVYIHAPRSINSHQIFFTALKILLVVPYRLPYFMPSIKTIHILSTVFTGQSFILLLRYSVTICTNSPLPPLTASSTKSCSKSCLKIRLFEKYPKNSHVHSLPLHTPLSDSRMLVMHHSLLNLSPYSHPHSTLVCLVFIQSTL